MILLILKKRNNIPISSLYNSLNVTIEIKENINDYFGTYNWKN